MGPKFWRQEFKSHLVGCIHPTKAFFRNVGKLRSHVAILREDLMGSFDHIQFL